METKFTVPATGVLDYQRFIVDPGFKEDVWIQAPSAGPGTVKWFIILSSMSCLQADATPTRPMARRRPGRLGARRHARDLWARFRKTRFRCSNLVFEVHYTPDGTEQTDQSCVAIRLASARPAHAVETNILANMMFRIPPGARNHKGQMTFVFPRDAVVLSFMPHMHLRGINARYDLTHPDGTTQTLLSVPDYDFGWQSVYRFVKPVSVPQGSKLTWTAHWDNSSDNPAIPIPGRPCSGPANLGRNAKRLDGGGLEEARSRQVRRCGRESRLLNFRPRLNNAQDATRGVAPDGY